MRMEFELDLTRVMPFFPDVSQDFISHMVGELLSRIEAGEIDRLQGFRFQEPYFVEALFVGIKALAEAKFHIQHYHIDQPLIGCMKEVAGTSVTSLCAPSTSGDKTKAGNIPTLVIIWDAATAVKLPTDRAGWTLPYFFVEPKLLLVIYCGMTGLPEVVSTTLEWP